MKKLFAVLLLLVSSVAFAQKEEKDPYMGVSKSQIMVWFGQPETKEVNRKGEVLTFLRDRKIGEGTNRKMPMPMKDERYSRRRIESYKFFFNRKDLVYAWKKDTL